MISDKDQRVDAVVEIYMPKVLSWNMIRVGLARLRSSGLVGEAYETIRFLGYGIDTEKFMENTTVDGEQGVVCILHVDVCSVGIFPCEPI